MKKKIAGIQGKSCWLARERSSPMVLREGRKREMRGPHHRRGGPTGLLNNLRKKKIAREGPAKIITTRFHEKIGTGRGGRNLFSSKKVKENKTAGLICAKRGRSRPDRCGHVRKRSGGTDANGARKRRNGLERKTNNSCRVNYTIERAHARPPRRQGH